MEEPPAPLLPPLSIAGYLVVVVGTGVLANTAVLAALFRRERNVFHSIVMQIAIADLMLLSVATGLDTWTLNQGNWQFGCALCVLFLGCQVLATTATGYLALTLTLHSLATADLEEANWKVRSERYRDEDSDEMRSSRHSLVAHSDSSTPPRTMNIDYRIANTTLAVAVPVIFVWVLSASLSVPEFVLASTVELSGVNICTLMDPNHRFDVYAMLAAFDLLIPTFALCITAFLALNKLRTRKTRHFEGSAEVDSALTLSIWLTAVFLLFNFPRLTLTAYKEYTSEGPMTSAANKSQLSVNSLLDLIITCLSYAASTLRPILCVLVLPDLRSIFSTSSRNVERVV